MSNKTNWVISKIVKVEAETLEEAVELGYDEMFVDDKPTLNYYNVNTGESGVYDV